ncbi:hypothetical protein BDN72DRAFT_847581 [Pluteus cervinus]|uniref:Uncharacterized protein n=1 Tax=Pluteus cervinus TaxID=181527 RepID=A0ACD3AD60_9AGAR|nr:hypothetical protein BDN72DRAFT_847581 [Pluteus cervinus]
MPRADSKQHLGTQFYHSQFSNGTNYLPDNTDNGQQLAAPAQQQQQQQQQQQAVTTPAPKKKHVCPTCDRAFTTSGHLARHSRVHTGERNHKCPFPGCETRCSRQDNLQQHYRIHLSPGSRRSSTRSAIARAMNNSAPGKRNGAGSALDSPSAPPPLSSPPALEPARVYSHHSTPPDSPPPLAQATLPATAHLPDTSSGRSSSSPQSSYSPINHHLVPMSSQGLSQPYSYRSGTTTYQEQSQGAGFTYVHTTPISHSSNASNGTSFSSYSSSHDNFNGQSLPHINTSSSSPLHQSHLQDSPSSQSSISLPSRHSISHISHPQSSYQNQSSSAGPPSPASSHSVSSHTSGPPTPTYAVFNDEAHNYHSGNMMSEQNGHMVHNYSSAIAVHNSGMSNRFESPPPILAPIQNERIVRRSDDGHAPSPSSPYIHHPQPLSDYQYPMGLGPGGWKSEGGMRKGVGTVVQ